MNDWQLLCDFQEQIDGDGFMICIRNYVDFQEIPAENRMVRLEAIYNTVYKRQIDEELEFLSDHPKVIIAGDFSVHHIVWVE